MPPAPEARAVPERLGLRAGEWVEVRSAAEVMSTLDERGRLDGLPFMPEMLALCGRRFQVYKSAHKSCDTIEAWRKIRRMSNAVHLQDLRCDGSAHGGCQAACLIFWKEAWLKRVAGPGEQPEAAAPATASAGGEEVLQRDTRAPSAEDGEAVYRCQATEHLRATVPTRWWDPRPYVQDLASGNVSVRDFLRHGLRSALNLVLRTSALPTRPHVRGLAGEKTPTEELNLREGEWVEVRSRDEIMGTINQKARNRGLTFDIEMLPFCGGRFRVLRRVEKLIDERSGRMTYPRGACLMLEGVTCGGNLSRNRMFCPRSIYPYWREIWLRRVGEGGPPAPAREPEREPATADRA